jgi:hypothetical protein
VGSKRSNWKITQEAALALFTWSHMVSNSRKSYAPEQYRVSIMCGEKDTQGV